MTSQKPIIIAAASFEVEDLRDEYDVFLCGVGPLSPCLALSKNLRLFKNKPVLYVGTAGSFTSTDTGKLFCARSVAWLPTCERMGASYAVMQGRANPLIEDLRAIKNLPRKDILCCPNVSLTALLPENFSVGDCLENLEFYSVARALADTCLNLSGLFYVTNEIGPQAHKQWKENFQTAAEKTAFFLKREPVLP